MDTRLMVNVVLPADTIYGTVTITVSKWNEGKLTLNSTPYRAPFIARPLEDKENVIPWTIAAIREAMDNAVAKLLDDMAEGKEIVMHEAKINYVS
jgi:hypothetical protein